MYVKDKPNVEYNSQAHMQSTDFVPALLDQWKRHSEALEKKWSSKGVKSEYL